MEAMLSRVIKWNEIWKRRPLDTYIHCITIQFLTNKIDICHKKIEYYSGISMWTGAAARHWTFSGSVHPGVGSCQQVSSHTLLLCVLFMDIASIMFSNVETGFLNFPHNISFMNSHTSAGHGIIKLCRHPQDSSPFISTLYTTKKNQDRTLQALAYKKVCWTRCLEFFVYKLDWCNWTKTSRLFSSQS